MSLQAMKSEHEPIVVGLAGMVQEQPATGLAGIDLKEICITMQEIFGKREQYAVMCKKYAVICPKYAKNMQLYIQNN